MTTVIVVDASVVATAVVDDAQDGDTVRSRLRGHELAAPEILDLEVLSVIRRLVSTRIVAPERGVKAIEDLAALDILRAPYRPLIPRCWELRENCSPYDAAYIALAEAFDTTLLTADEHLARAPGPTCQIEVLTTSS